MGSENENKKINNQKDGMGVIVDALHNKQKLSSLRTYQGDMAEFIKEKNESVISVSLKEKKRKEEQEKKQREEEEMLQKEENEREQKKQESHYREERKIEEKVEEKKKITLDGTIIVKEPEPTRTKKSNGLQTNLIITVSSILLVVGGAYVLFYIFGTVLNRENTPAYIDQKEIIPYSNIINVTNITKQNIFSQISDITIQNGINIIKISDENGDQVKTALNFFDFLEIPIPSSLRRDLYDEFAYGKLKKDSIEVQFIAFGVRDFGRAFSSMLEWEAGMLQHFNFMLTEQDLEQGTGQWKDLIIKNKDVRTITDINNKPLLLYTFLDKNTILITSNVSAIEEISNAFSSRSFAR
jgi:hypothetical protein